MRRLIFGALAVLAIATLSYGGNAVGQSEDPSSTTVVTTVPPTTEVPTTVPQDCAEDDPCFDCSTMGNHQCDGDFDGDIGDAVCIDDTQPQCIHWEEDEEVVEPFLVEGTPVTAG